MVHQQNITPINFGFRRSTDPSVSIGMVRKCKPFKRVAPSPDSPNQEAVPPLGDPRPDFDLPKRMSDFPIDEPTEVE